MPELPEVETVRRALSLDLPGSRVEATTVHERRLRRPVRPAALRRVNGETLAAVERRGKYLILQTAASDAIVVHLGMTGRVELFTSLAAPLRQHDHISWRLRAPAGNAYEMRYYDPRRFGLVVCLRSGSLARHALFRHLGPEPLGSAFDSDYLRSCLRRSRRPIKNAIMDARLVVGVGNIYASEALWRSRIHPRAASFRVGPARCARLVQSIRAVLEEAIAAGGTTLSDYRNPAGGEGYFRVQLDAYDRAGRACRRCRGTIRRIVQAGRATFYCPRCQH
jgi:formamidopyrimidine-DNA glycosylase